MRSLNVAVVIIFILFPPPYSTGKERHFQIYLSAGGKGTPGREEEQEAKAQEAEKSKESGRQHRGWKGRGQGPGARSLDYKIRGLKLIL